MPATILDRVEAIDWVRVATELDAQGWAVLPSLLRARECASLVAMYSRDALFRKRIVMSRHAFGSGEYKYFAYPLPEPVGDLRTSLYPHLVPVANRWLETLGNATRYPPDLASYLARCHDAGQGRPTPLMLAYGEGDYNRLHQDLYGEHLFPLQVAILLDEPNRDFTGGELVLTEQRPRMQSRPMVVPLRRGDAAVFAVRYRPVQGARRPYRVQLRHGVSRVHGGRRHALGIIFHDAA